MLSDEEIQVMFKQTMGSVSDFHSFRFDFARAVESAVLRKAVETVREIRATTIIEPLSSMKRGHEIACSEVIAALEGQWKP